MARTKAKKGSTQDSTSTKFLSSFSVPAHTKRAALAVFLVMLGTFLTLAAFGAAGIAGADAYRVFAYLLGIGYFTLPLILFISAGALVQDVHEHLSSIKVIAGSLFFLSGLGFVSVVGNYGGILGTFIASPAVRYFDIYAATLLLGGLTLISLLLIIEGKLSTEPFIVAWDMVVRTMRRFYAWLLPARANAISEDVDELVDENLDDRLEGIQIAERPYETIPAPEDETEEEADERHINEVAARANPKGNFEEVPPIEIRGPSAAEILKSLLGTYAPPPLSLLEGDKGKAGGGDIKANANIIKRTLHNFGIVVELDEISIGPSVTRYAIKPAEGVRLQKIVALQQNLELALAAHPVRIEAPIPGKSLVGIEVPNHTKMTVGLGALLGAPEFQNATKPLTVALGRDIAGGAQFADLAKMPHLLIAGATGSGKSVSVHAIISSLLFRLGPSQMRFIFIDPKRVELTLYRAIPHLLTPVITDAKRAIAALRWAGKEMERRYDILEQNRVRDVESYHNNILTPALKKLRERGTNEGDEVPEAMPYIVIVVDELADIMQTFPRELEAAIVRLAQMSRAVGIHLILSTQRPSVNVITGLIKANIPSRLALKVASQIDSRTILDGSGAEKLLGAGDMLYSAGDSKLTRLQSAFISEGEVKKLTDFISQHNDAELPVDIGGQNNVENAHQATGGFGMGSGAAVGGLSMEGFDSVEESAGDDDELFEAAREAVIEAKKASTSYLQRKLRIGYSRAARLIDLLEDRGVIGPGDGAKPREVLSGRDDMRNEQH